MTSLQNWAAMTRHFDALWDFDKHIQQCDMSSADSVDCDFDVVIHDLTRLPCVLPIGTSRPVLVCILVHRALL